MPRIVLYDGRIRGRRSKHFRPPGHRVMTCRAGPQGLLAAACFSEKCMRKSAGVRSKRGANTAARRQMSRHLCRREEAVIATPVGTSLKGCSSFRIFHVRPAWAGKGRTGAFPCQICTVFYSGFFPYAAALQATAFGRLFPYSKKSCLTSIYTKFLPEPRFSTGSCRTNGTSSKRA